MKYPISLAASIATAKPNSKRHEADCINDAILEAMDAVETEILATAEQQRIGDDAEPKSYHTQTIITPLSDGTFCATHVICAFRRKRTA